MNPKYRTPLYVALMLLGLNLIFGIVLQVRYDAIVHRFAEQQNARISQNLANIVAEEGRNWQAKVKQYTIWQAQFDAMHGDFERWSKANLVGTTAIEGADLAAVYSQNQKLLWSESDRHIKDLDETDYEHILKSLAHQSSVPAELKLGHQFMAWKGKIWMVSGGSIYRAEGGSHKGYFVLVKQVDAEFLSQVSLKLGYALSFRAPDLQTGSDSDLVSYELRGGGQTLTLLDANVPPFFSLELKRMMRFASLGLLLLSLLVWFGVIALYEKRHLSYVRKIQMDLDHVHHRVKWWPLSAYAEDYKPMAMQIQELMLQQSNLQQDSKEFAQTLPLPFLWLDPKGRIKGPISPLNKALFGNTELIGQNLGDLLEKLSDEMLSSKFNDFLRRVVGRHGGDLKADLALLPKSIQLRGGRMIQMAWYPNLNGAGYCQNLLVILRAS